MEEIEDKAYKAYKTHNTGNTIMEHIVRIIHKDTQAVLPLEEFSIETVRDEKKGIEVFHLHRNGRFIKKHNTLEVCYRCVTCKRENIVGMTNMLRKFNRKIHHCNTCLNADKGMSLEQKLESDHHAFEAMDTEFKDHYFKHYLDVQEFQRLIPKILSFHHDKFAFSPERFRYCPCVSTPNQAKFSPYVYDKERDVLEKMIFIRYLCDNCGGRFEQKELFSQKNKYRTLCPECTFKSCPAKLKTEANVQGENLTFQTKFEHKFIKYCNKHNILLKNGPMVPYKTPEGAEKLFRIAFYVPCINTMVEIKEQKFWKHKHEAKHHVQSTKEMAAYAFASQHNMSFTIVYPCIYVKFCKGLMPEEPLFNSV